MATKDISIIIKALDQATGPIKKIGGELNSFAEKQKVNFQKMAVVGTAVFGALTYAIKGGADVISEYESLTTRLKHITQTSTGATDEQVKVLIKQAEALEKVGVASKESIVQAQSQLATFDLQTETIERLIPSIIDYVIAEKGATASADDFRSMTNSLSQALNGNFRGLTNVGFFLDENTKSMIANGTEMERAAALASVLDGTYAGFNSTIAQTSEGIKILRDRELGNLQENIAKGLVPIINKFNETLFEIIQKVNKWMEENPQLTDTIIKVSLAVAGIIAVLGTLGLVIPSIVAGFGALTTAVGVLGKALLFLTANPIGLTILAIAGLVAGGVLLYQNWDVVVEKAKALGNWLMDLYEKYKWLLLPIVPLIEGGKLLYENWDVIVAIGQKLWNMLQILGEKFIIIANIILPGLQKAFSSVMGFISDISNKTVSFVTGLFEGLKKTIEGVISFATGAYDKVKSIGESAKNIGSSIGGAVSNVVGSVTGQRAFGGPIQANKSYLVGERGPEIFTPGSSGMIRNDTSSSPTININMGGVVVNNEADENRLVQKIQQTLTRQLQLNKFGIS